MYKNCKLILTNYCYKSITNTLALQINKKHVRTLLVTPVYEFLNSFLNVLKLKFSKY